MKLDRKINKQIKKFQSKGLLIAGVDEVGRGSLFGPIIVSAVILNSDFYNDKVDDSKKIAKFEEKKRLSKLIRNNSMTWSLGEVSVDEINDLNVFHATLLAMQRAIDQLDPQPDVVYVDGPWKIPDLDCKQIPVVRGDAKVFPIACASIVAKDFRDSLMIKIYNDLYPQYDLASNKGYRSPKHWKALKECGITRLHRLKFKDIRRLTK